MPSKYGVDKFYTKPNIVDFCLETINLDEFEEVIEPSAGNGSFSLKIEKCKAYDIYPENESIIKQDFFTFSYQKEEGKKILIIGNPPFGRQSNLAIAFFKKASEFADVIAFVLPKSFKKQSIINRLPIMFHLTLQIDLPENSFYYLNKNIDVPCVWQIWEKRDYVREIPEKIKTDLFFFVKKENADFSIRRVGVNAGVLSEDLDKSTQSHYFIKTENKELISKIFKRIKWEHNNTVGPRSISKQELLKKILEEKENLEI